MFSLTPVFFFNMFNTCNYSLNLVIVKGFRNSKRFFRKFQCCSKAKDVRVEAKDFTNLSSIPRTSSRTASVVNALKLSKMTA